MFWTFRKENYFRKRNDLELELFFLKKWIIFSLFKLFEQKVTVLIKLLNYLIFKIFWKDLKD